MRNRNPGKLIDHWLWTFPPNSEEHAFVNMVLISNRGRILSNIQGRAESHNKYQITKSVEFLAKHWCWNTSEVRNCLQQLEDRSLITKVLSKGEIEITLHPKNIRSSEELHMGFLPQSKLGSKPIALGHAYYDLRLCSFNKSEDVSFHGCIIRLNNNQLITSDTLLAKRWGCSLIMAHCFLKILEAGGLIDCTHNTESIIITIHPEPIQL